VAQLVAQGDPERECGDLVVAPRVAAKPDLTAANRNGAAAKGVLIDVGDEIADRSLVGIPVDAQRGLAGRALEGVAVEHLQIDAVEDLAVQIVELAGEVGALPGGQGL